MVELHRQTSDLSLCPKRNDARKPSFSTSTWPISTSRAKAHPGTSSNSTSTAAERLDLLHHRPLPLHRLKPAKKSEARPRASSACDPLPDLGTRTPLWVYIIARRRKNPDSHGGFTNDEISPNHRRRALEQPCRLLFVIKRENEPNRHYTETADDSKCATRTSAPRPGLLSAHQLRCSSSPHLKPAKKWRSEHVVR